MQYKTFKTRWATNTQWTDAIQSSIAQIAQKPNGLEICHQNSLLLRPKDDHHQNDHLSERITTKMTSHRTLKQRCCHQNSLTLENKGLIAFKLQRSYAIGNDISSFVWSFLLESVRRYSKHTKYAMGTQTKSFWSIGSQVGPTSGV